MIECNVLLYIYPSDAHDEDIIFDITMELEGSGYTFVFNENHFECQAEGSIEIEPEVLFDDLLVIDSKIKIQVRKCNTYWLRREI